jgi:hypothetical protein
MRQTMSKKRSYKLLLTNEPEGGYTVTVLALPGCVTYGWYKIVNGED